MNELVKRQFEHKARIAVFGDAILDEYYDVVANRVSPEFPIPVLRSTEGLPQKVVLGGAANVCNQFSNFNFDVSLFAIINETINNLAVGINTDGCVFSRGVPVKKRFYSDGFPLCRLDVEGKNYCLEKDIICGIQSKIFDNLCSSDTYDVVVFSDYDKGMFVGLSDFISRLGDETITIVDPKTGPIERWKGCTIIKPNAMEAEKLSGKSDWKQQCDYLMRETGCQAVVITQGGEGVVGNVQGSFFEHRPPNRILARSVVGAGDAFIAFLAMCMAHSIDIREAVKISFDACSLYVQEPYNRPIYPYQIESSKFVDPRNIAKRDFSLSFANGCWDILHPGHVELLKFARSKADRLAVALNSDESARRQGKSHPLINDLDYRKSMIASLGCVDFVLEFGEDTPYELMKVVRPDVLVKGSDWPNPVGSDIAGKVFNFELIEGISTTNIIEKIRLMTAK